MNANFVATKSARQRGYEYIILRYGPQIVESQPADGDATAAPSAHVAASPQSGTHTQGRTYINDSQSSCAFRTVSLAPRLGAWPHTKPVARLGEGHQAKTSLGVRVRHGRQPVLAGLVLEEAVDLWPGQSDS
jgi:hypothetical protein